MDKEPREQIGEDEENLDNQGSNMLHVNYSH